MASNITALEFAPSEIRVVSVAAQGNQVRIRSAFTVALDSNDTDEQIAEKLKDSLNKNRTSRGDAVIVVGRSDVEIREITVPPAPDGELPDLVRFQSRTDFAAVNDNWSIDFLPLSGTSETERTVLATALSNEVSDRFVEIAQLAGLKAKHIVLRPLVNLAMVQAHAEEGSLVMVADPNGNAIDLTLVDDKKPILTRTVRANASDDRDELFKQLGREVKRTLASASRRIGDKQLSKMFVTGPEQSYKVLADTLRDELDCETVFVGPFENSKYKGEHPENPGQYSPLVGAALRSDKSTKYLVDYLNPKKPKVKKKSRSKTMLYGGLLAATLLIGIFLGWMTLRSQQQTIDARNKILTQKTNENNGIGFGKKRKKSKDIVEEVGKVDTWLANSPNWLNELEALAGGTLDADRAIIDKFYGTVRRDGPYINLIARVKNNEEGANLEDALTDLERVSSFDEKTPRYLTKQSSGTSRTKKSKDYPYKIEFDFKVEIDPSDTKRQIDELARESLYGETEN